MVKGKRVTTKNGQILRTLALSCIHTYSGADAIKKFTPSLEIPSLGA